MLSSIREGFNNEGKGYGGIIIAFFCYSSCGDETNCCTAESRIRFCFVETSSTSLTSHEQFQGNFKDGSKLFLSSVCIYHLSASRRWMHSRETKPRFSLWDFPLHHTGATDIIQYWTKGWAWTSSTAVDNSCGWLMYILLLRRMIHDLGPFPRILCRVHVVIPPFHG